MTSHDYARFPVQQPHGVDLPKELETNQIVLDNGEIKSRALPSTSDRTQSTRLAPPDISSDDDWSAEHSSLEDYDSAMHDMTTIIENNVGGEMNAGYHTSTVVVGDTSSLKAEKGDPKKSSDSGMIQREKMSEQRSAMRQSIQIILEKTDKKGRYILTADDPELREILKAGLEREAQARENEFPGKNGRKRFRDLVFTRRFTTFDRQNPQNAESRFHGFFTLFWIAMGLLLARIAAQNWKVYGSMLGNAEILHMMLDRDVILLGITDGVMCLATLFGVMLQLLILRGYLSWNRSGWIIQNIWQTLYLAAFVGWTYYRDWPWTHTIFIVLHCLVFVMKQHSYAFYNGYLSQVYRRRKILEQKLAQLESMEPIASPATQTAEQNSFSPASGITATGIDSSTALPKKAGTERKAGMDSSSQPYPPPPSRKNSLTERRRSVAAKASTNLNKEKSEISSIASAIDKGEPLDNSQMEAFSRIIHSEIRSLNEELNGKSTSGANSYPKNLTFANWLDWTCLPTLVYELEYPRQEKINWWYVAEKTAATFGVIWVMVVISQAYIYPAVIETVQMKNAGLTLPERWREFPWIVSEILFPLLLEQLLSWYVIWECCLNVLAELTGFADRGFYGDWWNSVSWDQYARDWNRPVHNFLLRHVYHSSISAMSLSKETATFVTFLLSACVHELLMLCLFKKVRGYLFAMQLAQLPLASLSRTRWMKGRNMLGNIVFWFGLFVGPSVIMALYLIV